MKPANQKQLIAENEDLHARLDEAEETLRAIRSGEVDALVVPGVSGEQVFTLKGADHPYRILIEDMSEGALTLTAEGVILYANKRFAEMIKRPLEKVIGSMIHTWVAQDSQAILQSLLRKGAVKKRRDQLVFIAGDGTLVPVYLSVSNLFMNGTPDSFCLVATDLTEQKRSDAIAASEKLAQALLAAANESRRALMAVIEDQKIAEAEICRLNEDLEQRVRYRTANLETANKELEAFSYSVSHDLRAPLRSIDGFSYALLEDYQDKLDDTAKSYLDRVRKATQHMGYLIDDMLQLSRVTRAEFHDESIDLSTIVRKISEKLQQNNPDRTVDVIIREGVFVKGDTSLLQIVLENLLGNAWKFTGREAKPQVEFGTIVKEGRTACFIRDNGVGFDMANADKIFGAFQRLHTSSEFPGTGIGLATVQRIINRHNGQVWAESEVGKGATFFFTLPE
jgi:PAS domain S-box-containing protein